MTRKALIVAMSDYGIHAPKLTSVPKELERWQKLLSNPPYKVDELLPPLTNQRATPKQVLAAIRQLVKGASADDQLLFIFMGHGTVAQVPGSRDRDQALLVYPGPGGLLDGAVRESEIDAIVAEEKPPRETDITFIMDCCFAADYGQMFAFNRGDGVDAIPLFVPLPDLWSGSQAVRGFGQFRATEEAGLRKPLVFAASEQNQPAYEISDHGERRMLFTKRLLARLPKKRESFRDILKNINPLHPEIHQNATLVGNRAGIDELFPGERSSTSPAPAVRETPALEGVADAADATAAATTTGSTSIDLRVLGLGCFVTPPDLSGDYKVRLILPHDDRTHDVPENRHFACIEIAEDDIVGNITGLRPMPRLHGGVRYLRWLLDAHTMSIETGDQTKDFIPSQMFRHSVPAMTVLCPELRPRNPDPACFAPVPQPNRFAAFVDIPSGSVDVGPLDEYPTYFQRRNGEITWGPRNTPISVKANVPIISSEATIVLTPYPAGSAPELSVSVRPGSTILVANAREIDIAGDGNGTTPVPPEQFLLMYKLSRFVPDDPPLPIIDLAPIDACSVTTWP